jgi:alginate O-acetyltransferase complex protein AlgJ
MEKLSWSPPPEKKTGHIAFIISFLLLAGAFLLGGGTLIRLNEEKPLAQGCLFGDFINGEARQKIQKDFDGALISFEFSRNLWGALEYGIFSEGRDGVVVGKEGMLFTSEEWAIPQKNLIECQDEITHVRSRLAEEGVQLIIALIPAKATVYPLEASPRRSPAVMNRYGDWMEWFDTQGISAPDLLIPFRESRELVFFITDTHWNEAGADLAAQVLAQKIIPLAREKGVSFEAYEAVGGEEKSFEGDLLSFIPGHQWISWKSLEPEVYHSFEVERRNGVGLGLFDVPVIPVALTGTSYSRDKRWNWEDRLKDALSLDVLNLSEEGQGPFVPMESLLEDGHYEETGAAFVIWEIPERYLAPY